VGLRKSTGEAASSKVSDGNSVTVRDPKGQGLKGQGRVLKVCRNRVKRAKCCGSQEKRERSREPLKLKRSKNATRESKFSFFEL
jgi:hypothetical protein